MKSRYHDVILDGRWKMKEGSSAHHTLTFTNIYNGNEVKLTYAQVEDILNGRSSVSKIMCRRIGKQGCFETNKTVKFWNRTKAKYANKDKGR